MLISFKKDKAFINILSDLEVFLSEAADKLDIDTKALSTISTIDNTRKFRNWNKIETVDTSNYIKFYRYEFILTAGEYNKIMVPWKGYDPNKDLQVKVYLDGILLIPGRDYTIEAVTDSTISETAGYYFNFGPYQVNHGKTSSVTGRVSVTRISTNLPPEVMMADIEIKRTDISLETAQRNIALEPAISDADIAIEVYVNGVLYTEDNTISENASNQMVGSHPYYRLYSSTILFAAAVSGQVSIIRYRKI